MLGNISDPKTRVQPSRWLQGIQSGLLKRSGKYWMPLRFGGAIRGERSDSRALRRQVSAAPVCPPGVAPLQPTRGDCLFGPFSQGQVHGSVIFLP